MDLSLITSLYRSAAHLSSYKQHLMAWAEALPAMGWHLEVLIVANDATPEEDQLLNELKQQTAGRISLTRIDVPRETLYASWNRGIAAASAPVLGFWNVDDERFIDAIPEGLNAIAAGANLVDYRFEVVSHQRLLGMIPHEKRWMRDWLHHPTIFGRRNGLGPFALIHRDLYDQVGPFEVSFRVSGDTDWARRALPLARGYCAEQIGGRFHMHGGNLSSTGSARQAVEDNIVFLRHERWDQIRPAPPEVMGELWAAWGDTGVNIPEEIRDLLWDEQAEQRWQAYQRQQRQPALLRRARLALARRGITWDVS